LPIFVDPSHFMGQLEPYSKYDALRITYVKNIFTSKKAHFAKYRIVKYGSRVKFWGFIIWLLYNLVEARMLRSLFGEDNNIWLLHNRVEASIDLFRYLLIGDQLIPWKPHPLVPYTSKVNLKLVWYPSPNLTKKT